MNDLGVFLALIPATSVVIYIVGLAVFWMMAFFVLYHLIRFGVSVYPKRLALIFLLGSVVISLLITLLFISLG